MLVEIVETFKKLSDGSILRPGDILDIPQEKALRLVERGRARFLPSRAHGNAPKNDSDGSGEIPLPPKKEMPIPARFKAGDHVRFAYMRALDVLEGLIIESKHHGPVIGWWYRIETGESKFWASESYIQQGGSNANHD